jgi:O-antigen/teichoic acid export membrane protein
MEPPSPHRPEVRGYPLGALFLLITVCAMLAGFAGIPLGNRDEEAALLGIFSTLIPLILVCSIWGWIHQGRIAGLFRGAVAGVGLTMGCGAIAVIRPSIFFHVLIVALVGAVLILAIGLFMGGRKHARRRAARERSQ